MYTQICPMCCSHILFFFIFYFQYPMVLHEDYRVFTHLTRQQCKFPRISNTKTSLTVYKSSLQVSEHKKPPFSIIRSPINSYTGQDNCTNAYLIVYYSSERIDQSANNPVFLRYSQIYSFIENYNV